MILPTLAIADHDNGKWIKADSDEHRWGEHDRDKGDKHIPVVPEANAGWVLIPFLGAVLLYSWVRVSRAKA